MVVAEHRIDRMPDRFSETVRGLRALHLPWATWCALALLGDAGCLAHSLRAAAGYPSPDLSRWSADEPSVVVAGCTLRHCRGCGGHSVFRPRRHGAPAQPRRDSGALRDAQPSQWPALHPLVFRVLLCGVGLACRSLPTWRSPGATAG